MKKIVLGCGLVVPLLAIVGGAGMYYFVYRPAKAFVTSMAQLGEVAEMDAQVSNRQAFAAPDDGAMTPAQVQRFVAVQETMHTRLGTRAKEFEVKYKALGEREQPSNLSDVVGAYKDLFGIIAEAKRAQVDALNAQRFSLAEYQWVKHRFYEAAGVALTGVDLREIASQMQQGNFEALKKMGGTSAIATPAEPGASSGASIPDANQALVAPYKDKMQAWFVYGAFGL